VTDFPILEAAHASKLLAYCPNLIYIYDMTQNANVYANREIAAVLGYTTEEIQAMGSAMFITLTHPDDLGKIFAHQGDIQAAQDGEFVELEYRMKHKNGTWRWLVSRDVVYERQADGSVAQYLGVVNDITEKRHELDWAQRALKLIPLIIYVFDLVEQRNIYANSQIGLVLGYTVEEIQELGAELLPRLMHPDDWAALPATVTRILQASDDETIETVYRMRSKAGIWVWLQDSVRVFARASDGSVRQYLGATQDITSRQQEEEERVLLQQQVIDAQQAALRELSTPLIPVSDDVLVMPLIGSIDSQRAQLVLETLLQGVADNHARAVILDITGVQVVDTQVANAILRAAQSVKLLGAKVIITGIRPEVAQTLVTLGADMSTIVTRGTLQSGIAYALK
jgi:rsbT co-antagonist protein RsbR